MHPTTYLDALNDWLDDISDSPARAITKLQPDDLGYGLTRHAAARARQRGIDADILALLPVAGTSVTAAGDCTLIYIGRRKAFAVGCPRLANLAMVLNHDGFVVTTYRVTRRQRHQLDGRKHDSMRRHLHFPPPGALVLAPAA